MRRLWANTDEGAEAMARDMLRAAPSMTGFELWNGSRKISEGRKRPPRVDLATPLSNPGLRRERAYRYQDPIQDRPRAFRKCLFNRGFS